MKFNLGDYDLGDLGLGDFSLGDLGLGDFDLIPGKKCPYWDSNACTLTLKSQL